MSREGWRRLPFNHEKAGRQLALSESLLAGAEPVLYWYQARSPAMILGAGQKLDRLDLAACRQAGYQVYRRASGGTLVMVGPDFLSLDIFLPPGSRLASGDVTLAYRWLGETWQAALARLGAETRLVEVPEARRQRQELDAAGPEERLVSLVCFGTLSPYEVTDQTGRKLIGLAQLRRRAGSLLQAGLHFRWPGLEYAQALALQPAERALLTDRLAGRATGLDQSLENRPATSDIIRVFEACLVNRWPVELYQAGWSQAELARAAELEAARYQPLLVPG